MKDEAKAVLDNQDKENKEKPGRLHVLLQDQRVLFTLSVFLAAVVWLVLAIVNGDEQEKTIEKVPVRADFSGTVAEELGLRPFWSGPLTDPNQLAVTVVVNCKRYENITADTLEAVLVTGSEFSAGEHTLSIRVAAKREADQDRFTIVSVTPDSTLLYFDHERTVEFELTPELLGALQVEEGFHAEDVKFSKKNVSVSGPARLVDAITAVRAEIPLDEEPYNDTVIFPNVDIVPVDINGDTSPYLTVEKGDPEINATLPVWKRATLTPAVGFLNVPVAYLSAPLPVTVSPVSVRAALPEERIAENLRYTVGEIDFRKLAPGKNRFTFPAEELKEIRLFDGPEAFTAVVDLDGFAMETFALPGARIKLQAGEGFIASFGDITAVTVVGPPEVLEGLTSNDLTGEVTLSEDAQPGRVSLPVTVRVDREDCWVYGEYSTRVTLTEE